MNWLRELIKRFLCEHEYTFVRNFHGDEIIQNGWKRSLWKCNKCDKYKTERRYILE